MSMKIGENDFGCGISSGLSSMKLSPTDCRTFRTLMVDLAVPVGKMIIGM